MGQSSSMYDDELKERQERKKREYEENVLFEQQIREIFNQQLKLREEQTLTKLEFEELPHAEYNGTLTCAICIETFKKGDNYVILPCGHMFHKNCVETWLTNKKNTCPTCRGFVK